MVEQVKNRKLFHLTETKPYKQAFVAGQKVTVGQEYTPFFGFYEGEQAYWIDGGTVKVKAVEFLKRVRDKTIFIAPDEFARIAAEVATHYVMLCREIIMEEIRRDEFNGEPPSRQRCLYACDTLDEARFWKQFVGQGSSVCKLTCTGTIHRADASWLLGDSEPLSVTKDRARKYWRGEAGANPQWETLFVGDAVVSGFGL